LALIKIRGALCDLIGGSHAGHPFAMLAATALLIRFASASALAATVVPVDVLHNGRRFILLTACHLRRKVGPLQTPKTIPTQAVPVSMSTEKRNASGCGCLRQIGIKCCHRQARAQRQI
jgi:hypothetical protein